MNREPVTFDERGRVIDAEPDTTACACTQAAPEWWADDPRDALDNLGRYALRRSDSHLGEIAELAERGIAWAVIGGIALYVLPKIIKGR
jgi:hypothetical protein